jgi:Nucleoside diphosphate kinase
MQSTFAIIKPDAVSRNLTGEILAAMEASGLKIVALKRLRLSKAQAAGFYAVHSERPFFDSLTDYMSSGPVVCVVLRGEDAVPRWRALMGATNPAQQSPAPCVTSMAKAWKPMLFTARTPLKPRLLK